MDVLNNKKVTLGVTSSIAIYRACDLVRLLMSHGAQVQVIMTSNAAKLISPQVFRSLSGREVKVSLFGDEQSYSHIIFAQASDIMLVAPATANFLGKAAGGIADDALTTTLIAMNPAQVIIAPAMNYRMYENSIVQENIKKLGTKGCKVMGTEYGSLACGETGKGRFPDLDDIMEECRALLTPKSLEGKKVLVTAGPTQELLDPVRYLTNRSSGRMGYALAKAAWRSGAQVTLISGPTQLRSPYEVEMVNVQTALQMEKEVKKFFKKCDYFISAAAVSDFRPDQQQTKKIKKAKSGDYDLDLVLNPDILLEIADQKKSKQIVVGFALESEEMMQAAMQKLEAKKMDLIVANSTEALGAAQSQVVLMDTKGIVEELPMQDKDEIASRVIQEVAKISKSKAIIPKPKNKK